ncbi:tetratricopeptide repeat protein 37 [Galendromus occidentalis]|uniref:Tetratricopeptide repeat protein 37 n=1 Tax=Galendromus occidentalis TaxID=34638 RepID=A0AAJ6QZ20_9ACAR|nr:tetratricopeptide repeat protein 37 [Galendromus occidentalis]
MGSKALLKEARQALDLGESDRAIESCESVLREEPDHFTALLILGAAATAATHADLSKKALKALVRAAEVKPDQEAPWQGLLRLFRKYPGLDDELYLKALDKALEFNFNAKNRVLLNIEKAELTNDWTLLRECVEEADTDSMVQQRSARAAASLVQRDCLKTDLEVLRKISFLPGIEDDTRKNLFLEYFARLEASECATEFAVARTLISEAHQNELSVHIFIKSGLAVIALKDLAELFDANPNSSMEFATAKAKLSLLCGDVSKLEAACQTIIKTNPQNFEVWKMLLTGLLEAGRFRDVETHSKVALKNCKSNAADILTILARALYEQDRHREALILFAKAETLGAPRDNSLRLRSLIESGRAADALKESLGINDKMWALRARMALNEDLSLSNAELSEVGMPTAASYLLFKKRHNDALKIASAALGQNPKNTEVLTLLGEIYLQSGHPENASKCLQQSFVLNRNSSRTGKALSRALRALKRHDENRVLLESITSDGVIHDGNHWAFAELGIHYLEIGTPSNAVALLQKLASFKPSSFNWELLAEAYASRKSLAAAVLCYRKSIETGTVREAFITYRLACVTRDQEQYEEAISLFESALEMDPNLIISAHDLGQCCLLLAGIRLREVLLEPASLLLNKALLSAATSICSGRSDLVSLWSLLGDVLLTARVHNLKIRAPVDMKSRTLFGLSEGDVDIKDMQLVSLAENTYLRCISLNPNLGSVWHNLALVYVYKHQFDRGITCLKRAIKLDAKNPNLWNALGVVSIRAGSSVQVCQSAFIRALNIDPDHAPSWANLGFLYIKKNLLKEANQCFSKAQAADPLYVECWLGQATLAATVGHFDACDLYRHSNVVKPTIHAIICNLAMQGQATEELLFACERALHCKKEHPACAAIGYVLLSHGLTVEARRVISRCQNPECKVMFAQALLRDGGIDEASSICSGDLPGPEKQRLRAYIALESHRREEAVELEPKLKEVLYKSETLQYLPRISSTTTFSQGRKKSLQKQLRRDPRQDDAWRRLSECLLGEGKFETSLRLTEFIKTSYQRESLRLIVVAALMAGRKRNAYRAASKLVRQFPDRVEHWLLFKWACLSIEKRNVIIMMQDSPTGFWVDLYDNVKDLDNVLSKGGPSKFAPSKANKASEVCSKLLFLMEEKKIDKTFLSKATSLLKTDHRSEAGLFLTGMWALANDSEDLYGRCLKGLPATSSLGKLLESQHAAIALGSHTKSSPH